MRKRGIGHVEFIISFVLFMSAIGFALYFFSPGDSTRLVDSSLDYLAREIDQRVGVSLQTYFVKVNPENIVSVMGSNYGSEIAFFLPLIDPALETSAETFDGGKIDSVRNGLCHFSDSAQRNCVYLDPVYDIWDNIQGVFVYYSEEFADLSGEVGTSAQLNSSFYNVSSSTSEKVISERRLKIIKEQYGSDYFSLKEDFNMPSRVSFGFELVLPDLTISAEQGIPENSEVFSENKRIKVLREDGSIIFGDFRISVW